MEYSYKQLKLLDLYDKALDELESIGVDFKNNPEIGSIELGISKRSKNRYGVCKQEEPDKRYKSVTKRGYKRIIKYEKYMKHRILISDWVLDLNDDIIKNTIVHELIHCVPYCNDHGEVFKKYAKYINEKLGYDINRTGNKKEDYEKSNLNYSEESSYNYKVVCNHCGQTFYRQRINMKKMNGYKCGICNGKFDVFKIK